MTATLSEAPATTRILRNESYWISRIRRTAASLPLQIAGVAAVFAITALAFFFRQLVLDQASIPFDMNIWHYPQLALLGDALRRGEFPMWNPFEYGGMPFLEPSPEAFYPLNLAILELGGRLLGWIPYRLIEFELALHFPIAGFTTYLLARSLGVCRIAAILAGLAYMLGPFLLSQTEHEGLIVGAAWVPLVFLTAQWTIQRKGLVWPTLLAIALCLNLLAGFVPASLSLAVALIAVFVWAAARAATQRPAGYTHAAQILGRGAVAAGLSVTLAAIQILPFLETYSASIAADRTPGIGPSVGGLATLLVPDFFDFQNQTYYWGNADFTQIYYYLPPLVLVLACAAVVGPRRCSATWLIIGAIVALVCATQAVLPLLVLLEAIPRPVLGGFEFYTFRMFSDLGFALAAGLGLDALLVSRRRWLSFLPRSAWALVGISVTILIGFAIGALRWRATAVAAPDMSNATVLLQGTALAVVIWAATATILIVLSAIHHPRLREVTLAVGCLGLALAPAFAFGSNQPFNTVNVPSQYEVAPDSLSGGKTQVIAFFQQQRDQQQPFRIGNFGVTAPTWATSSMLWGLDNANGANPVLPSDTATFLNAMSLVKNVGGSQRTFQHVRLSSPLLNLLNVKYLIASGADGAGSSVARLDPSAPTAQFQLVFSDFYQIYENTAALPRALLVPRARVVQDRSQILDLLSTGQVDPRSEVLLERPPAPTDEGDSGDSIGQPEVTYAAAGLNRVGIYVQNSPGGFLLMLDPYSPSWTATLDGVPAHVERADYLFRAIQMPPGTHDVVMSYEPKSLQLGLFISTLAAVLALGILGRPLLLRRRVQITRVHPRARALTGVPIILAAYAILQFRDLRLPGLYYDELIQVVPALAVVRGGLWSNVNWIPSMVVQLFGHSVPLMTMDYMGSLKTFVFIPVVAAAGITPESVRITTVVIGALSILAMIAFVRRIAGMSVALIAAALVATDLSFVYYARVDYGPSALMLLLKCIALWQLSLWWQTGRSRNLFIGALALGLGVYNKVDFLWIVAGVTGAAALAHPGGVRARTNLASLAIAGAAFVLGAAPLVFFNLKWPMPTLAAVSSQATAGGPSGNFATQLLERAGALEHLLDGALVTDGTVALTPTGQLVVWIALISALLALAGTLAAPLRTELWRPSVFSLCATVLIALAAAATPGGFAGHHLILTYPFPHILAATGLVTGSRWLRQRFNLPLASGVAAAGCLLAAGQNWLTVETYVNRLELTGGSGNFSDAIYRLADMLEQEPSSTTVVDLDWGFHFPLVGLSQGRIHSVEVTDGSGSELAHFLSDPNIIYVAHPPDASNFPHGLQAFNAAAQAAGVRVIRERRFITRDGRPAIDVYVARPGVKASTARP